jgi:hypothetical protein
MRRLLRAKVYEADDLDGLYKAGDMKKSTLSPYLPPPPPQPLVRRSH